MQRFGKLQVALAFEAACAGKQHRKPAHEKWRTLLSPLRGVHVAGCDEVQQSGFQFACQRLRKRRGASLAGRGHLDDEAGGGSERDQRAQVAGGL